MKIDRLEPSKHKKGRFLVFLEDGSLLRVTEQELLSFGLRAGDELDEATISALKESASDSGAKAQAAALIGRRAMSRADLMKKLQDKGATETESRYACEWLEAIGALNDADFAALLVRHCASRGYGPARCRQELVRHGIDRTLWDEAMDASPDAQELISRYLFDRFRGQFPDEKEIKRASDALLRRGFQWGDVKAALRQYTDSIEEE
ncbi:MAG: recombination regulator RecX [Oscillibacter sp.]|jgi:regulatory protein|nr:recombination regulator RecX [Oscillibacter sp.]